MADNVLKKEFQEKDIQRIRNLVKGDYSSKTTQGIGYVKPTKHHIYKEGDVWEENGKKWTIKNGVKQNISKLKKAKQLHLTPIFCPSCSKPMKKRFDPDYFKVHKKCYDCVIEFETLLKFNGEWEKYHNSIANGVLEGYIQDLKDTVEEQLNESQQSYITEHGDVENWVGDIDKTKLMNELQKTIEYLESLKT